LSIDIAERKGADLREATRLIAIHRRFAAIDRDPTPRAILRQIRDLYAGMPLATDCAGWQS
jgi:hypothetical protein